MALFRVEIVLCCTEITYVSNAKAALFPYPVALRVLRAGSPTFYDGR